uniref:Uncharacterized protein n=1 Tax=Opuntia streptacantha TaxID=393608 RepID=A0A7C9ESJ6_OPUST
MPKEPPYSLYMLPYVGQASHKLRRDYPSLKHQQSRWHKQAHLSWQARCCHTSPKSWHEIKTKSQIAAAPTSGLNFAEHKIQKGCNHLQIRFLDWSLKDQKASVDS